MRKPDHAYRIKSVNEFRANIKVGQHYAVRREYLGYPLYHHMLIAGRIYIISPHAYSW